MLPLGQPVGLTQQIDFRSKVSSELSLLNCCLGRIPAIIPGSKLYDQFLKVYWKLLCEVHLHRSTPEVAVLGSMSPLHQSLYYTLRTSISVSKLSSDSPAQVLSLS
jgi:hypothetical protein